MKHLNRFGAICAAMATAFILPLQGLAWGQKGHDVTAYIAENHLTPATSQAVAQLLDGKSLVYWANWADNVRDTPEYSYTKTWHFVNVDEGQTLEQTKVPESGTIITAMRSVIALLCDSTAPKSVRADALKFLTHFTGDLHQPLHCGHLSDLGGNTVKVDYFKSATNLHRVWDSQLIESGHKWSYTEWQQQIDRATPEQQAQIIAGSIDHWAVANIIIAADIYADMPQGCNLSYDEVARWTPVIEQQLLSAGLRLAHILNLIFDPLYMSAPRGVAMQARQL